MTEDAFNWRGYVANRDEDDLWRIFAECWECGVVRFEMRFLHTWDINVNQRRCDFVAHLSDGRAVRFHPNRTCRLQKDYLDLAHDLLDLTFKNTKPVIGAIEYWVAELIGPVPPRRSVRVGWISTDAGPADHVLEKTAIAFIRGKMQAWLA